MQRKPWMLTAVCTQTLIKSFSGTPYTSNGNQFKFSVHVFKFAYFVDINYSIRFFERFLFAKKTEKVVYFIKVTLTLNF